MTHDRTKDPKKNDARPDKRSEKNNNARCIFIFYNPFFTIHSKQTKKMSTPHHLIRKYEKYSKFIVYAAQYFGEDIDPILSKLNVLNINSKLDFYQSFDLIELGISVKKKRTVDDTMNDDMENINSSNKKSRPKTPSARQIKVKGTGKPKGKGRSCKMVVVPVADQVDIPVADQVDVPVADQVDIPVADQVDVPVADQVDVPVADPVDVPVADPVAAQVVRSDVDPDVDPDVDSDVDPDVDPNAYSDIDSDIHRELSEIFMDKEKNENEIDFFDIMNLGANIEM
jgi:hypothetical protein